jgi:hypothetical protein
VIKQMNEMPSSLPNEARGIIQTNRDSSNNFVNVGLGTMNNYKVARDIHFSNKE